MDDEIAVELDAGNESREYEVETIQDSAVYAKEVDEHLLGLYDLVAWKGYWEEKNTWEPLSAVMHLRKMISTFHKDYPEKLTATLPPLNIAPLMARPIVKLPAKQKWGRPKRCVTKRAKWDDKEKAIKKNLNQCGSKDKSRRVAKDLSL